MINYQCKVCGHRHVTQLNFWGPSHISGMAEATVIKLCMQEAFIKC